MPAAATGEALLWAQDLCLARGGRELFNHLNLRVLPGQLWQVEGLNGAGKTSLLRILAGLSRYGFDGTLTTSTALIYLGHHSAVKPLLTPRENLAWHPSGEGIYTDSQIDAALDSVGLYGYEDVPSRNLSAGQHRRVNLARLFLAQAPLWILDEPFTALDREGVAILEQRLAAHVDTGGAAIVTSHQPLTVSCAVQRLSLTHGLTL